MFTGIIKANIKANKITKANMDMVIQFPVPKSWKLEIGQSINIDGVCSTVIKLSKGFFEVFYMEETLDKTTLKKLDENHQFNFERSLKASDLMGGHFVSGHIDTTGTVKSISKIGQSKTLTISLSKKFTKYLIYKGSVSVNGASLTVVEVNDSSFVISLIPYTLSQTNLGDLKVGDQVNIEVDLLSKYIEKLFKQKSK